MVLAISTGLRLARFNVMIDDPEQAALAGNFFTGMPAPRSAITARLRSTSIPGMPRPAFVAPVTGLHLAIAFLMVARLPVFSGKRVGSASRRRWRSGVRGVVRSSRCALVPWPVLTVRYRAYC